MDPYFEDEIDFSLPLKKKKKKKSICVSASEATVVKECNIVPCPMNELPDSDSLLGMNNMSVDQTKESDTPNNSPKSGEEIFYSDDDIENLNNSLDKSEEIFYSDGDLETAGKENSPSKTVDSVPQFVSMVSDVNVSPAVDLESVLDFSLPKKKKKKKPLYISENTDPETDKHIIAPKIFDSLPTDIEADYTHEYLLTRIFKKMREKNPLIDEADRNKVVIKPPQIIRVGTKRSSFVNFLELCKIMHRTPAHLQSFLLVELGTTGSIDGNGHLLIKGKFQQKQVESVLRRYIKEYVTCHSCHSPSTVLLKETRLYFIKCESCGSQSSVPVIKSGYQAVINKRAATRSKASN